MSRGLAPLCLALALCNCLLAQAPQPANPQTPAPEKKGREYTINVDVNHVVLHATVVDKKGRMVNDLKPRTFRCTRMARCRSSRSLATPTSQ